MSTKIVGLHRFYYGTSSKQLLAASGDYIKYYAGSDTWTDIKTDRTTGLQTYFATWGPLDKSYIANGTDIPFSWDGSSAADISAAPATTLQFLPYQDRLLSISGGDLTWSDSFSTGGWESVANCGVRPDTKLLGMIHHSATNVSAGFQSMVLLAGTNGMYLFQGTDLRIPYTTGNYTIYPLAINVGCNAPRTMVWTPKGTMWLGIDKQVYLLPFGSATPVPVGSKIQSNLPETEGIEKIPATQIENACATYHKGFYMLSVARSGQTSNNVQWWLDVTRLYRDESEQWGPWFGPMLGQTISCFANQNGTGDDGELMGGESTVKGYVYQLNQDDVYGDIDTSDASTKAIQVFYKTNYNPLGNPDLRSDVHKMEAELLDVLGTVNIDFHDITGTLVTGGSFGLSGSAEYWNDNYWDEAYWSSSIPTRQVVDLTPAIQPRRLSILLKHNISNDKFELYSLSVESKEQRLVFD